MGVSCAPQHHFFFRRSHAGQMLLFALAILDSANSANWGSESAKISVSCAPQQHFFSAFSCRRNATFCHCIPGFCPFWLSPFDVQFWRAQRFLDPLVFISFQGAAAAAAGRGSPPPRRGRAWVCGWFYTLYCLRRGKSKREAGGWRGPSSQPPRPRCAFSRHLAKMGGDLVVLGVPGRGGWGRGGWQPPPPVRFLETYGENGGSVGCGNEALAVVWAWFS